MQLCCVSTAISVAIYFSSGSSSATGAAASAAAVDIATFPWSCAPSAMTTLGAMDVALDRGRGEQLGPLVGPDLAVDPAADDDRPGVDVALDLPGRRDGDPALDLDVALEAALDDDVLVARELADEPGLRPDDRHRRGRPAAPPERVRAPEAGRELSVLPKMATPPSERPVSLANSTAV